MVLLITIALAIAAPRIAESIRRDKEEETIHRGKQYARAIQMYYAKYNRYPNSIDQLMKTDNVRFLRKRYLDPMTGKDDWRIIHLGEATVPAMGLFGQQVQMQRRHYAYRDDQRHRRRLKQLVGFLFLLWLIRVFARGRQFGFRVFGIFLR